MMNFNLDNLSEIIDEVLTEFCVTYPIPNFNNKEQLEHLRSVLEQFGAEAFTDVELMEAISLAPKKFTLEAPKKDGTDPKLAAILKKKVKNADTGRDVTVASALNYKDQKGSGARSAYHAAAAMLKGAGYSEKNVDMVDDPNPEEPQYYAKQKQDPTATAANLKTLSKLQQLKKQKDAKPQVKPSLPNPQQSAPTPQQSPKVKAEPIKKQSVQVDTKGTLRDLLGRFDDKGTTANSKNDVKNAIKTTLQTLTKFASSKNNPNAKEHGKVKDILVNLFNKGQKPSASDRRLLTKYVRAAEPTETNPNTCKIYVAREPGNFKSQGPTARVRIYVGKKDKSTPVIGGFRQWGAENGIAILPTSTFGGKKTTANQTYVDDKGNTKLLKNASKVIRDNTGNVTHVKIGTLDIIKTDPNQKGISPKESKLRAKNNRIMEEYAEKIEAGDMDFIDMDKGLMPDSPKNRVIVIQHSINGMASNLAKLAQKAEVADKETIGLIKELADFSKTDPNKQPEKWLENFEHILSKVANHEGEPSLREAWANYAEIFVAIREMHDNGKGTENGKCALLPQSTTLETVDVITVSNGKGDNRIVTLDGRSVKKGVGGPSALGSKARKSTYKNDPKGLIKKAVLELVDLSNVPYSMPLSEPLAKHTKLINEYKSDIKKRALALNVDPKFISNMEKEMKVGGRASKKIASAYAKILLERQKAQLPIDKDTAAKIKLRLEAYYMYQELAHEAYNKNVDIQDFANDSVLSQKEDRGGAALARAGKIGIDRSDGIDILAYPSPEFNVGFNLEGKSTNNGAGRFHNAPKRG